MGLSLLPVKYERIKFLVLALKNSVEVYAWAPKPYHKFMAFKVGIDTSSHKGALLKRITVFEEPGIVGTLKRVPFPVFKTSHPNK